MPRFNTRPSTENHIFIVTSVVPAALFLATLLASVHVSRIDTGAPEAAAPGYTVLADTTA